MSGRQELLDGLTETTRTQVARRFHALLIPNEQTSCWEWSGALDLHGYGLLSIGGRSVRRMVFAHRVAYTLYSGRIPDGLEVDHLCRNRKCVNPAHLEAVTHAVNTRRSTASARSAEVRLARTHCPHGHPFDEENTYLYRGRRECRACRREAGRRARRKAA